MKISTCLTIFALGLIFTNDGFGQKAGRKKASQSAFSYENNLYHLTYSERDPKLYVKNFFFRRDLPHRRKWFCRVDIGASWYDNGWYFENHFLFGRPIKKVDFLTGISLRNGNLPEEFLSDDAVFLNPEMLFVVRPHPFFGRLTVEVRLNMAFIDYYNSNFSYRENIRVPGFGLSIGYVLKKTTR